jgi:hypothetical protein
MELLPRSAHPILKKVQIILLYGPKAKGGGQDGRAYNFTKQADDLDPRWRVV